jgi:hypothetical protein
MATTGTLTSALRHAANVSTKIVDFDHVPHSTGGEYATFDPAIDYDCENDRIFASPAVSSSEAIGPVFGGERPGVRQSNFLGRR